MILSVYVLFVIKQYIKQIRITRDSDFQKKRQPIKTAFFVKYYFGNLPIKKVKKFFKNFVF